MDCPSCKHTETRVIETRQDIGGSIRRRRECTNCGLRVTTQEHVKPITHKVESHVIHSKA